jgi:hypothetical protein
VFLAVDLGIYGGDVSGRICVRRSDFFQIGGYDESMDSWGHDDDDIKSRLSLLGLKRKYIEGAHFLKAIAHGHSDRLANEYTLKFLKNIYMCNATPSVSYILFFFTDQRFAAVTFIDNITINSSHYSNALNGYPRYHLDIEEKESFSGTWSQDGNSRNIKLITDNGAVLEFDGFEDAFQLRGDSGAIDYYEVRNMHFIQIVVMEYSYARNRIKLKKNKIENSAIVNSGDIGQGTVYKNFDYHTPINI